MREPFEITFMDDPDEVRVGLWASSSRLASGIYLEFIKTASDGKPNRILRISIDNHADALELAHLIIETDKQGCK